jgi:hypothetical protein
MAPQQKRVQGRSPAEVADCDAGAVSVDVIRQVQLS